MFSKYLHLSREFARCVSVLRSNLETRNPFYDVHLKWYEHALKKPSVDNAGLTVHATVCVSSQKLRPIVFYSISQCEAFQTYHFENAIHVIPIKHATRAIFINVSRSTNTLRFGKHPKEHRKGPSNHPCEELPYEASLSALFMRCCLSRSRDQP